MLTNKTMLALLLLATVGVTPASANYFDNPNTGMMLNIGSAPNPTPSDLRAIGDARVAERADVYPDDYPQAAPPPPAPPPPREAMEQPAPVPAPASERTTRRFMVFFDFDKSALTPEGRDIVARAADTAKHIGPVRIIVTGHTDTVGSKMYNQRLSQRRAMAVKREMARLGLDERDIMTVGKGFTDPLVATGPGVREPQNRRAVIDLGMGPVASLGTLR